MARGAPRRTPARRTSIGSSPCIMTEEGVNEWTRQQMRAGRGPIESLEDGEGADDGKRPS